MKPKTMILMVVAVGCGLVASYMTSKLIADRNNQPQEETVMIVVAKKNVNKWILLKKPEDLFELREYRKKDAPDGAVTDVKFLQDKRPRENIAAGVPVLPSSLMSKDLDGLAYMVKPGSRAIAIKVNAETLVGGFVLPDSKVDVVCTQDRGDFVSSMILQNMTVLAVDQNSTRDPEKGTTLVGSTVTLAALPEEATRLRLAQKLGELALLLRSPTDETPLDKAPISRPQDLFKPIKGRGDPEAAEDVKVAAAGNTGGILPPVEAAPAEKTDVKPDVDPKTTPTPPADPPAKPVKVHRVTIIEGDQQRQEVFYWDDVEDRWKRGAGSGVIDEGTPRRDPTAPKPEPRAEPAPRAELAPKPEALKADAKAEAAQERRARAKPN